MENKYTHIDANLPRMLDISAVRADSGEEEVRRVAEVAAKYNCICAFAMPNYTEFLGELIKGSGTLLGGTAGFPSGADTTAMKIACAKEMVRFGCDELDMVIAIGALKSGKYDYVLDEIKALREIAEKRTFKAIIEVSLLTNDEIMRASELAVRGGVDFVKSGTGWQGATTVDHIKLMKRTVGNEACIKAAGGVRDLATIDEMIGAGCTRFGIGVSSAVKIMEEHSKLI